MSEKSANKERLFQDFISQEKILIVDRSKSSLERISRTLVDMGAKQTKIACISSITQAKKYFEENKPRLVISDYYLNGGIGFDLLVLLRECQDPSFHPVFVLITNNMSQSIVAKAAEYEIDSYLLKPYTLNTLKAKLIDSIQAKVYPSDYLKLIFKAKEYIEAREYEIAEAKLNEAIGLEEKPVLAMYYLGMMNKICKRNQPAVDKYEEGLSINSLHFRCQRGMFEIFMQEELYDSAYQILKRLNYYYPNSSTRLIQAIRLCIKTQSFRDIDEFYKYFELLDYRDENLIKAISSGLFISGKYFIMRSDVSKGVELFRKVVSACEDTSRFHREIIETLYKYNYINYFNEFFDLFPRAKKHSVDYEIVDILINHKELDPAELIARCEKVFEQEKNLIVFKIMTDSLRAQKKVDKLNHYLEIAVELWPDRFQKIA
jgi:CheY-like chemotaxis protein